jgi:ATP-dependent helicase HepA
MTEPLFPGQRWISDTEPELGLGVIMQVNFRYVDISFPAQKTSRKYSRENAPLRRVTFKPGNTIQDRAGATHRITAVEEPKGPGIIQYICGASIVAENDISDTVNLSTPLQRLFHGIIDSSENFEQRSGLLQRYKEMLQSPVRGYVGGRIDLLPHQLFIAETVTSRRVVRALLADETGLGKTIEACLILHRLISTGRAGRALVVAPEHLVHQWFVELLRRFNLTFTIFSKEVCCGREERDNPFIADQFGIIPMELLTGFPDLGVQAANAGWDLVIVDEAHHVKQGGAVYSMVKRLASQEGGLLLLTATPEQLGREDHFTRLQLLDPERYPSFDDYKREYAALRRVNELIETALRDPKIDSASATRDSLSIAIPRELVPSLHKKPAARDAPGPLGMTGEEFIDYYGTGRIMFRNTRRTISGFPEREVHLIPLRGDKRAHERICAELSGKQDGPVDAKDPRIVWLVNQLKAPKREKRLIICSTKEKAASIRVAIKDACPIDIALFHEEMTILQRDRNAAWFAEHDGAAALVSSEIGSEGRNFQFCHMLILFDLPLNPELLEQRIGRLDRIGQRETIRIYVPFVAATPHESLCRWYHEGLDAFRKNVPAAGRVFETICKELFALCSSREYHAATVDAFVAKSREMVDRFQREEFDTRDRLFELQSSQSNLAAEVIHAIRATDERNIARPIMTGLFRHYGVAMEDAGGKKQALITAYVSDHAFPLPRGERPIVTFDRAAACSREDIEFLTIDHPMVGDSLDLYLSSDHGTTAFATVIDPTRRELALEAVYILECVAPPALNVNRFLAPSPLCIVVDRNGNNVTGHYAQPAVRASFVNGPARFLQENYKVLGPAINQMALHAEHIISESAVPAISKALSAMKTVLDREIDRSRFLQEQNVSKNSRPLDSWIQEKNELEKHLNNARVRQDSLRVIWRGPSLKKSGVEIEEVD